MSGKTLASSLVILLLLIAGCMLEEVPTTPQGASPPVQLGGADLTGACCLPYGTCEVLSAQDCAAAGGAYQGDGTNCDWNPCPFVPPSLEEGACCFEAGICLILAPEDCIVFGGAYQGDDTVCDPNPCPLSPTSTAQGACCFQDGACQLLTSEDCTTAGGAYQGDETACDPNPCPHPPPPAGDEGCGLGYWKNHLDSWDPTGHAPGDLLGDRFTFPDELGSMAEDSYMEALRYSGGNGIDGAARLLLRDAIVAVLNASHPDVNYPLGESEIADLVDEALTSLDRRTILDVRHTIDMHNTQGCPLH